MSDEGGGASRSTDPAAGTSSATDVSLREFVSMQIGYERRGTLMLLSGVFGLGAFAWAEIQRRLVNLNGEAERIKAAQSASVSADTYQANERQRQAERRSLEERLGKYDENFTKAVTRDDLARETRTDRQITLSQVIAIVAVAATIAGIIGHLVH